MMRSIDVTFDGREFTFRSNENGDYLFEGVSENRQISCESGFQSLHRMKLAIRDHLAYQWELAHDPGARAPRIAYRPDSVSDWER